MSQVSFLKHQWHFMDFLSFQTTPKFEDHGLSFFLRATDFVMLVSSYACEKSEVFSSCATFRKYCVVLPSFLSTYIPDILLGNCKLLLGW